MSNIAFPVALARAFGALLSKVSRLALAAALCGTAIGLAPAMAEGQDVGPLFGTPGDGAPYVDRLHPRVDWPPLPERRASSGRWLATETDVDGFAIYGPPPPLLRDRKRDFSDKLFGRAPRPYEKTEEVFEDTSDPRYPGKREHRYEEKPDHPQRKHAYSDRSHVGESHAEKPYSDRYQDADPDRSYWEDPERVGQVAGYGRLFHLKPSRPQPTYPALKALGRSMIEEGEPGHPAGDSEMPAGYTFLGQFIDHDLTLDKTTDLRRPIRGDYELKNARTPELDLDSVYGRGPEGDPSFYRLPYIKVGQNIAHDGGSGRYDLFRLWRDEEHGRGSREERPILGDPRNDENLIIAQLVAAFIAFHNRTVDILVEQDYGDRRGQFCDGNDDCSVQELAKSLPEEIRYKVFEQAKDHVIHFYHRVILEDFLPWIIGPRHLANLLKNGREFFFPKGFRDGDDYEGGLYIPVEFSAAAFRFGHSQVRDTFTVREDKTYELFGNEDDEGPRASEPVLPEYRLDWRYFFEIGYKRPYGFNYARRIDPELVRSLHYLQFANVVGKNEVSSLAARNLMRGKSLRLPSGQQVAEIVLPALQERGLLGKGNWEHDGDGEGDFWRAYLLQPDDRIRYFLGDAESPLWYYLLHEASVFGTRTYLRTLPGGSGGGDEDRYSGDEGGGGPKRLYHRASFNSREAEGRDYPEIDAGHRLGPVGAQIVGEVLTGLLEHYRVSTGKGLDYDPAIKGSESVLVGPNGYVARHRYLMRNFLIDAGVVDGD